MCQPQIQAWRNRVVDHLIEQSSAASSDNAQYSLLKQASLVGYDDPVAIEAMAQFWLKRGEVDQAIATYQARLREPNPVALGQLALQGQDYTLAHKYFLQADREDLNGASAGLAVSYYNQDRLEQGCEASVRAYKLDLQDATAKSLVTTCAALNPSYQEASALVAKPSLSDREVAYLLLDNKIYKLAEPRLQALTTKSIEDYLALARLAAARGELDQATHLALQASAQDKSSIPANELLAQLYTLKNDQSAQALYAARLQQLQFGTY